MSNHLVENYLYKKYVLLVSVIFCLFCTFFFQCWQKSVVKLAKEYKGIHVHETIKQKLGDHFR